MDNSRFKKYREKIKEQEGLTDTEFNKKYQINTARNRGLTTTEYNRLCEANKASKLGITVKQLRHFTYISKRDKIPLYDALHLDPEEYYRRLKWYIKEVRQR